MGRHSRAATTRHRTHRGDGYGRPVQDVTVDVEMCAIRQRRRCPGLLAELGGEGRELGQRHRVYATDHARGNWRTYASVAAAVVVGAVVVAGAAACIAATAGLCAGVVAGAATAIATGVAAGTAGSAAGYAFTGDDGQGTLSWAGLGTNLAIGAVVGGVGAGVSMGLTNAANRITAAHKAANAAKAAARAAKAKAAAAKAAAAKAAASSARMGSRSATTLQPASSEVPRGPGFKERIDFGYRIGTWVGEGGTSSPTPVGILHYRADGSVHIVPGRPS